MRARFGQTEMVGLVFIVVLLVVGALFYVRFAGRGDGGASAQAQQAQASSSLLVSLLETTVPSCGTSFERVAAACLERRPMCPSGDPCREAQEAMERIAAFALDARGAKYNLSVEGSELGIASPDCASADPEVDLIAAPRAPIVSGTGTRHIRLSLCG